MRIAQVSPLDESCPPQFYGGTERVVSYLTEELVRRGHEVTLFASGDSRTEAALRAIGPRALRLDSECKDRLPHHLLMLHRVMCCVDDFDIVHFHTHYLHFPLFAGLWGKTLTTLHGRLDGADLAPLMREFAMLPLVSISSSQRAPLPWANWYGTVYHGLPTSLYSPGRGDGGYLAYIGRISPEKRPDWGIEIARRAGMPLKIAAKVDMIDQDYYHASVEPLINGPLIEFLGEIGENKKGAFLGDAIALLFPIDWPEPFGLALIEAMACGTPVIAMRRGAVPEIIDHGVTGLIADNIDEAVAAIPLAKALDRAVVRRRFEERFSVERMGRDYLAIYDEVLHRGTGRAVTTSEVIMADTNKATHSPESGTGSTGCLSGSAAASDVSGQTISDAQKQMAAALLTQFTALRAEIQNRSTAQASMVTLNITAIGLIAGFFFAQHADARVLFVIPVLSSILGLVYVDHAINIGNIGRFIQTRIMPELARSGGATQLPDYEVFVREFERRGGFRLFLFGIPILFMFGVVPLGALVLPFMLNGYNAADLTFLGAAGLGGILLLLFMIAWIGIVNRAESVWLD